MTNQINCQKFLFISICKGYEAVDQLYWKKIGYKKIYYYILAKAPRDLKKKVRTLVKK